MSFEKTALELAPPASEGKKKFNHRHIIVWLIFVLVALWSIFICRDSYIRLFYSVQDLGISFVYAMFGLEEWCPFPENLNRIDYINIESRFPISLEELKESVSVFFELFFSRYNFLSWLLVVLPKLMIISQLIMLTSLALVVRILFKYIFRPSVNNDHGKETKPLQIYKKICSCFFKPVYIYTRSVYLFFRGNSFYWNVFLIAFFCSTNVSSIVLSAIAYFFYFLVSFDFLSFFVQLYKLSVDLIILFSTLPLLVWLCIGAVLFDKITKCLADARLDRQLAKDESVVRSFGLVVFVTGVMRSGKTLLITAFQTIKARIYRKDSKKTMLDMHSMFPYFPFSVFQQEILRLLKKDEKDKGRIYSAASLKVYLDFKESKFSKKPCLENIYGYDYERYGMYFDNGIKLEFLWDKLYSYARAFIVYTEPCYFISSYAIRDVQTCSDVGNMPSYNLELVRLPSFDGGGMYSHVLDEDFLRPGKKMDNYSKKYGIIEHGIIGHCEIDKERGNSLVNIEVKGSEEACNPKNDLFNQHFKMMGHGAMIEYKCYISAFFDAQRANSWEADGRELTDWICIEEVSEDRLALSFFLWRDIIGSFCEKLHDSKTFEHWYYKGNTTLFIYILWQITTFFSNYRKRIWNRYGYRLLKLSRRNGDAEGDKVIYKFYDFNKLTRADMYATDSHFSYFRKQNLNVGKSFNDIKRFDNLHPSFEELSELLNSHTFKKWLEQVNNQSSSKSKKKGDR